MSKRFSNLKLIENRSKSSSVACMPDNLSLPHYRLSKTKLLVLAQRIPHFT